MKALAKQSLCDECKRMEWALKARETVKFNGKACKLMDELNRRGFSFVHAMNGEEYMVPTCGTYAFLDGYDEQHGIVFEYDEAYHESADQKKKDIERQEYIFNYFWSIGKPIVFVRYSEVKEKFYRVYPNGYAEGFRCELQKQSRKKKKPKTFSERWDQWQDDLFREWREEMYCYQDSPHMDEIGLNVDN